MTDVPQDAGGASSSTAALLRAARDEQPPKGAELRALSALGISTLSVTAPATNTVATTGSRLALLKWLGAAAALGLLALALRPARPDPLPAFVVSTTQVAASAPKTSPLLPPVVSALEQPATTPLEPPVAASPARNARVRKIAQRESPNLKVGLREELMSLESARAVLRAGDAARALQLLAVHERKFTAGSLQPEADLLRVQALGAAGETERAARLARSILRDHPRTQHARELQQWLRSE